jgi:hypothetical protein
MHVLMLLFFGTDVLPCYYNSFHASNSFHRESKEERLSALNFISFFFSYVLLELTGSRNSEERDEIQCIETLII